MMSYINLQSSFSELMRTPNRMKQIILSLAVLFSSCGTFVGNGIDPAPKNPTLPGITSEDFMGVLEEYKGYNRGGDCGSYTQDNSELELENGRSCIAHAEPACEPSKYLYDRTNPDGTRFVSVIIVYEDPMDTTDCLIYVHTVSNEPHHTFDDEKRCSEFTIDEIPELTCGIGN